MSGEPRCVRTCVPPVNVTADEVHVSDDAKLAAGAFATGAHDDMATALGLASLFDLTG
jgi:hypothetical protein